MTNPSGDNWTGNIPGNGTNAVYRYYIWAVDGIGRTVKAPAGAPASLYSFTANATDTTRPTFIHTPIGPTPKLTWPVMVNCQITHPIGVDSGWVTWRKGFAGARKRFNMANTGGANWSGAFNSTQAEVAPGDTIYYRIVGRSSSTQHVMDSTAQFTFPIIAQATACIGTGTSPSNYPFTTYWEDGRTDMLYTAAEIIANQGGAGYVIKVGFNVITADPAPMNGFKVKLQNTTATSLTGFLSSGWTVCYDGVYTLPGTGWQYVTLTTQFLWDGVSNLALEVCYNNAAYTSYSPVNATSMPGMTWGQYTDLPTGDGCTAFTAGTAQAIRPNTCFVINPVTGVGNIGSTLPSVYKLSQNYPNPFNPVTAINFDIPKQSMVSLKIYDVLGREVKTLVNEVKAPGSYKVDFNASEFASGVYFYRLETSGFVDVKRMVLIK